METARATVADLGRTPPPLSSPVRAPAVLSQTELVWSLLDVVPDAVLLCDRDGEVLLVNEAANLLFGARGTATDQDVVGRNLDDLVPGLEEAAAAMTGHPSEAPASLRAHPGGEGPVPVECRIAWISTDEGKLLAAFLRRS
jgi:PAS domain-containing protein